jgi:hypothetical protein
MKATLARLAAVLQQLFSHSAELAAASSALIKQPRKLTACAFAQGLTFCWLQHPNASTSLLASFVANSGSPMSEPGLCQRFTPAASAFFLALLKAALQVALTAPKAALPVLQRFNGVYLFDGTQLTLPASLAALWPGASAGTACLKVMAGLELLSGALFLELGPGRQAELAFDSSRAPLPKGALRLCDLGFFDLDLLQGYSLAGVFWVSRAQPMTLIKLADGRQLPLWQYLKECRQGHVEEWVEVGVEQGLACRLLAWRCPQEVTARRLQKALSRASKRGEKLSEKQRVMCHWTVLLSNAAEEKLSADEAWVVYRVRWQMELLFKRWKSLGGLSSSRGEKEERVVVEVYAKLLGAVIQNWLGLLAGAEHMRRSVWKEVVVAQGWGLTLLLALGSMSELMQKLGLLAEALRRVAKVARRRGKASAMQTLERPGENGPLQGEVGEDVPVPAPRPLGRPRRSPSANAPCGAS